MTKVLVSGIVVCGLLLAGCVPALHAEDLLVSGGGEHPRTSKRVWIRRATLVAGCAASLAFDTITTRRAFAAGAIETNSLLADSQGRPQWSRIIGVKSAGCAASAILQETHIFGTWKTPTADHAWTFLNLGVTAEYTWAGFHNLNLATSLSK
jgi:hypothetical protein